MRTWGTGSALLMLAAMLTGCCGAVVGDLLFESCKDLRRHQGEFVGNSSDLNGNRCETYQLRDKSYQTICDRSSPSYTNPSAEPYPQN